MTTMTLMGDLDSSGRSLRYYRDLRDRRRRHPVWRLAEANGRVRWSGRKACLALKPDRI